MREAQPPFFRVADNRSAESAPPANYRRTLASCWQLRVDPGIE